MSHSLHLLALIGATGIMWLSGACLITGLLFRSHELAIAGAGCAGTAIALLYFFPA